MGLCKSLSSCYPAALLSSLTCRAEPWPHGLQVEAVPSLQAGSQGGPSRCRRQRGTWALSQVPGSSSPTQGTCCLDGHRTAGIWLREKNSVILLEDTAASQWDPSGTRGKRGTCWACSPPLLGNGEAQKTPSPQISNHLSPSCLQRRESHRSCLHYSLPRKGAVLGPSTPHDAAAPTEEPRAGAQPAAASPSATASATAAWSEKSDLSEGNC